MVARDQLAVMIPSLEQVNYDAAKVKDRPNAGLMLQAITEFNVTRESVLTRQMSLPSMVVDL